MVKENIWMAISRNGSVTVRKSRPNLRWDEVAMKVYIEIPDELFKRPTIEAKLTIKDVPNTAYNPEVIINTKELIEQQTGAKIDFRIIFDESQSQKPELSVGSKPTDDDKEKSGQA